jgi:hypothetical protein
LSADCGFGKPGIVYMPSGFPFIELHTLI